MKRLVANFHMLLPRGSRRVLLSGVTSSDPLSYWPCVYMLRSVCTCCGAGHAQNPAPFYSSLKKQLEASTTQITFCMQTLQGLHESIMFQLCMYA